jgi:hypothetical protein
VVFCGYFYERAFVRLVEGWVLLRDGRACPEASRSIEFYTLQKELPCRRAGVDKGSAMGYSCQYAETQFIPCSS